MAHKASTFVVPSKGWWRKLSVQEFQVECDRLRRDLESVRTITFTHRIIFGAHCIGRAAGIERLRTQQYIGIVLLEPPPDLVPLLGMMGVPTGKITYLMMPETFKPKRICSKQ